MNPQPVRLFVPFSADAPWIVRGEVDRVGTYLRREEAITAALAVRAKLARAWDCRQPPVRVQQADGSWQEIDET
jgi:hypothetical protein